MVAAHTVLVRFPLFLLTPLPCCLCLLADWIRRWLEKHAELSDASTTYDDALSQLEVQLARLGALSGKRPGAYSVFYDANDRVLPQPTDTPDSGERSQPPNHLPTPDAGPRLSRPCILLS